MGKDNSWDDHKYVMRVKVKGGNGKNKWRYFYTMPEYKKYLGAKTNANAAKPKTPNVADKLKINTKKLSNLVSDGKKDFNKLLSKKSADKIGGKISSAISSGKKEVDKMYKSIDKAVDSKKDKNDTKPKTLSSLNSTSVKSGKQFSSTQAKKDSNSVGLLIPASLLVVAVDFVHDLFDKDDKNKDEKKPSPDTAPKSNVDKLKDPDERADYDERLEYQKNEPDFMKDVPDIPADEVYTKFEDQNEINEVFDPYDEATSTNCGNCSAAYELRRRGYDVEAQLNDENYNGQGDRVYDYFENAQQVAVNGDGSSFVMDEDFTRKAWNEGVSTLDKMRHKEDYEFLYGEGQKYTAEGIEKAILDNNPPGSRGFIDVFWEEGGGHSIVYEVDSKGKVTIRDSQTYDEYSVDELASRVNYVTVTRTDNLKLKKEILNTVKPNEKKEREYYMDEGWLIEYEKRRRG